MCIVQYMLPAIHRSLQGMAGESFTCLAMTLSNVVQQAQHHLETLMAWAVSSNEPCPVVTAVPADQNAKHMCKHHIQLLHT